MFEMIFSNVIMCSTDVEVALNVYSYLHCCGCFHGTVDSTLCCRHLAHEVNMCVTWIYGMFQPRFDEWIYAICIYLKVI